MTTKTHVKYRMSVMKGQRNFFQAQFDELKTAEAFGRSCVREETFGEFVSSTSNNQKLKAKLNKKET